MAEKPDYSQDSQATVCSNSSDLRWKIQQKYVLLVEKLRPVNSYIDTLFAHGYMTAEQCALVRSCKTEHDRAREFLDFMLLSEDAVLHIFMERLEELQTHLQKQIRDAPDSTKPHPKGLTTEGFMKRCLEMEMETDKGSVLKVVDVRERLQQRAKQFGLNCDFPDDTIRQKVKQLFPDSTVKGYSTSKPKRKCDTLKLVNVRLKTATAPTTEAVESVDDSRRQRCVDDLSVEEVCDCLQQKGIKEEIIESFRQEEISGAALKEIFGAKLKPEKELLNEIHPGMSFGQRSLVMKAISSLLETEQDVTTTEKQSESSNSTPRIEETYRKFDTQYDSLCQYKVNRVFPKTESRPGNLLEPIHRYIPCCQMENISQTFSEETLKFAAACMNERTNATIHFGVGDRYSDKYAEGQILGLEIDKTELTTALEDAIKNAFREDEVASAQHCIRPPEFIRVIPGGSGKPGLFVVEVDIVPVPEMCEGKLFDIKLRGKKHKTKGPAGWTVHRLEHGVPAPLSSESMTPFLSSQKGLDALRASKEQAKEKVVCALVNPLSGKALQNRLIDLLCRGEENLNGEIYPVLVVNSPSEHMTRKWMKKNLLFIKHVPWRVVFDFGDGGENSLFRYLEDDEEQVTRVMTVEEFDPRSQENAANSHLLKNRLDRLKTSSHIPWIFVNGYTEIGKEPLPAHKWKKERATGFMEAVRFFHNDIPENRATVMILILSPDYDVLVDSADKLCIRFQNKWFILSETQQLTEPMLTEFLTRRIVGSREEVEENCVIGMKLSHVSQTIQKLLGSIDDKECIIPMSAGTIRLREKVKNDLVELEVLGCNQCDGILEEEKLQESGQSVEEKYYAGAEVDWWNFWFGSHVLKRQCHAPLEQETREVLNGEIPEDERVGRVTLQHQPGAGGTTSARQVLWDLRMEYRCAVVRRISDQTCDQISRLHMYEDDEQPRPLLLLFDNYEEERVSDLKAQLEEHARLTSRRMEGAPPVFYVFLVCRRSGRDRLSNRHHLKHDLHEQELVWFRDKYTQLERSYKEQEKSGNKRIEPRLLISFNIMKENFSQDYIQRTVKELTKEIKDPNEKDVLKYIALLNSYDLFFRPLPAAGFDAIMASLLPARRLFRFSTKPRWENYISSALKVLLNETSRPGRQKNSGLRIINNLLSKTILTRLLQSEKQTTSEAMKEFVDCAIFSSPDHAVGQILEVVRDLMKKRARKPDGNYETKFSPLIQTIVDDKNEGISEAASLLENVYALSNDVYVAQHLARLYIYAENWKEATSVAKMITYQKPDNSSLWDTFGNVFKAQLQARSVQCIDDEGPVSAGDVQDVIDLALDGLEIFRKEQSVSKADMANVNHAGFFGEIEMIVHLLVYLAHVEDLQDIGVLRRFLLDRSYIPDQLEYLGKERISKIKDLHQQVFEVMSVLDDEFLHLRDDIPDHFRRNFSQIENSKLIRLKEDIQNYFGEDNDIPPSNLSEEEKCKFRRRRMMRLGGTSFRSIYDLRKSQHGGEDILNSINELVELNLKSPFWSTWDLHTKIRVSVALSTLVSDEGSLSISQPKLAAMSKALYDEGNVPLEVYLFITMFNWPRENPGLQFAISANKIPVVIKEWKAAYYKMYPRQREENRHGRKKETTMFFLAKGRGMASFAHQQELRDSNVRSDKIWRSRVGIDRLQRIQGTLLDGGSEILTDLEEKGNKITKAKIPTSYPHTNSAMWKKRVYFVLGFTWSGPKAYDVDVEEPKDVVKPTNKSKRQELMHSQRTGLSYHQDSSYVSFQKKLSGIHEKLASIKIIRHKQRRGAGLSKNEVELLKQEAKLGKQREELIQRHRNANDVLSHEMY